MRKIKTYNTKSLCFPERVTRAMEGLFSYPLTIVEAPMGYGKTTAIREHLNKTGACVLWHRIDDNDTDGFWAGFCHQLSRLDKSRSRSLIQLGLPNDSVSRYGALEIIEAIELTGPTMLVIDDYHLTASADVDSLIEFLAQSGITDLHIVLATRFTELPNLEELSLKGYLHHVTKETFELKPEEITEYYKLCGISLKTIDADKLYKLTEGWISALYLLMLTFVDKGAYSGTDNIYKLMEKAVYASFSDEIKEFLVTMCIFDIFTFKQAAHMWGKDNAGELLTEVVNKNAFVRYDPQTRTYQIHSLFSGFLKEVLESKNIKQDLYRKAARWFLGTGGYRLAMHYFYLCHDFEGLFRAFEQDKSTGVNSENNKELLIKYLVECPDTVKAKHHLAVLIMAFRLYAFNEINLFRKTCGELMRNMQADGNLGDDLRRRLLGEYEMLMSFTGYNDIQKMAGHHQKACLLLDRPPAFIATNAIWTFGSPSVLYMFYRETGKLAEHVGKMNENMPRYCQLTGGNGTGSDQVMKAEWHFYRGDFGNAEIEAHQAMHRARSKKQTSLIICVLFLEMRIALIRGDFAGLSKLLQNMQEEIAESGEYLLMHTKEVCEGYIFSLLQQGDRVPGWLETGDFSSNRLQFPVFPMLNIVYGRALLIKGDYLKLIGSARHFNEIAAVFPNLLGQIHTQIYLAAANHQVFKQDEALAALRQALDLAMPDRVYMPFVENSDYIKPLLEELGRRGCYPEDIAAILDLSGSYRKAVEQIKETYCSKSKPRLTARETEIARLAAEGFSNREIGARLFISENTVKTQLKGVFDKLGVKSRALLKQCLG